MPLSQGAETVCTLGVCSQEQSCKQRVFIVDFYYGVNYGQADQRDWNFISLSLSPPALPAPSFPLSPAHWISFSASLLRQRLLGQ